MSKQSEAKERQGYEAKPVQRVCGTCKYFKSDKEFPAWMRDGKHDHYLSDDGYMQETNKRCGIGGFAVKKTATCRGWRGANE